MNQRKIIFPLFSLLWIFTSLALGVWWVYLILIYEERIVKLGISLPEIGLAPNFINMLKWEGSTLIVLIISLSVSLIILYYKDQRKTKSLQAFFAALTHELKTPLASIRLQTEVINALIEQKYSEDTHLETLSARLIEDTGNLETQMDKILQLSRIERGGNLNPIALNIEKEFLLLAKKEPSLNFHVNKEIDNPEAMADKFALELIFKNLIENTKNHSQSKDISVTISEKNHGIFFSYNDKGTFTGDIKKLGKLFYKHNSTKGSGIGVYLIKRLMDRMKGKLSIENNTNITFNLIFQKSRK